MFINSISGKQGRDYKQNLFQEDNRNYGCFDLSQQVHMNIL